MQMNPAAAAPPETAEEAVIGLLMQAGRKLRTRHPDDQLDPSTIPLLKTLLCSTGMRVSDLATCVELDVSTVSRSIKQLEDKGIVERTADPDDGRASLVRLTDAGSTQLEATFRRRFERIKAAFEPWNDADKERLRVLLVRLTDDLRATNDHDEIRTETQKEPVTA